MKRKSLLPAQPYNFAAGLSIALFLAMPAAPAFALDPVNIPVDTVIQAMPDDPPSDYLLRVRALAAELQGVRAGLMDIALAMGTPAPAGKATEPSLEEHLGRAETLVDDLAAAMGAKASSDVRLSAVRRELLSLRRGVADLRSAGTAARIVKAMAMVSQMDARATSTNTKAAAIDPLQPTLRMLDPPQLVYSKLQMQAAESARRNYDVALPPVHSQ